jgi:hypothetical protein
MTFRRRIVRILICKIANPDHFYYGHIRCSDLSQQKGRATTIGPLPLDSFHPESALFRPGPAAAGSIFGFSCAECLCTPPRKPLISSTFRWGAGQPGNGGAPNCTRHDEKCLLSELETLSISSAVSGWIPDCKKRSLLFLQ